MPDEYSIFLWVLVTFARSRNMQDFQLGCDPLIVEYSRLQPVKLTIIRRVHQVCGQPIENQDYR